MIEVLDREVDANFDAFQARLPELINHHAGKFVLMRHQKVEDIFDDLRSALSAGSARFHDKLFSIQEVTDRPVDLGFFSHAVNLGIA